MTERKATLKQVLVTVATIGLVNIIVAPAIPYFFGESYLQGFFAQAMVYFVITLVCLAGWFIGIKVLHLDARGPVPWYASPVVWLTPLCLLTILMMFLMGG